MMVIAFTSLSYKFNQVHFMTTFRVINQTSELQYKPYTYIKDAALNYSFQDKIFHARSQMLKQSQLRR